MRLTRRSLLAGGAAAGAATIAGAALAQRPQVYADITPIEVEGRPIHRLSAADPDRTKFGDVTFRSGLELRSPAKEFGGFSGLWRSSDGRGLVALADNSQFLRARVQTSDGLLAGLADTTLAPLMLTGGKLLRKSRFYDTESLAISGRTAYLGVERNHAVVRFSWNGSTLTDGTPIELPEGVRDLRRNSGLEALAIAPPGSRLAGALLAVAEQSSMGSDTPTAGFILTGSQRGAFSVRRSDGYDIADMAFLPGGDLVLLERSFSLFGFSSRMRRIAQDAIRPGSDVDGDIIYRSDSPRRRRRNPDDPVRR